MTQSLKSRIRSEALRLGFEACGFARADAVAAPDRDALAQWLEAGCAAGMQYMHNHFEKRTDPRLLVEGCRTLIVVALNYFPAVRQRPDVPQFAAYAYGEDYHDVVRQKLRRLLEFVDRESGGASGRLFVDSAPVLERYWAVKAGLGFIGRNTQLILPHRGSHFFIGELLVDIDIEPDAPLKAACGTCTRCIDACPTKALSADYQLDARRCISCQTIENRGNLPEAVAKALGNRVYGCDTCQAVCPHNRFATPCETPELQPSSAFLSLDFAALRALTEAEFRAIFRRSAVKRAGFAGLKRNVDALSSDKSC
jgi:epoxyqueuosine reductase